MQKDKIDIIIEDLKAQLDRVAGLVPRIGDPETCQTTILLGVLRNIVADEAERLDK